MKRLCLFTVAALLLCTGAAYAQSAGSGGGSFSNAFLIPTLVCQAGSNSTGSNGSTACGPSHGGGSQVLFGDIKVPSASNKNVLVMASLESSILTDTQVASSNGNKSTSSASAALVVTPKVFECTGPSQTPCSSLSASPVGTVTPDHVTFNSRMQTLTANLLGLGCTFSGGSNIVCTSPETIELILDTTTANAFNFLVTDLPGAGVYQVQLGLAVSASATTNSVPAGSTATIGVGAGSLVEMIVQAQTPFDSIKLCPGGPQTGLGGPTNCGP
jgi:hypothetical protein